MYFPGDNKSLGGPCEFDKPSRRKKKRHQYQAPEVYEPPSFQPCLHRFFRTELIERDCLTREEYVDMLATPKAHPWLDPVHEHAEKNGKKSRKRKHRRHEEEAPNQEFRCVDFSFAEEFINDMWNVMSPDVADRLIEFLVSEFGMTVEEAEDFIDCKSTVGKPRPCVKQQSKAITNLGPKHKWIKRFSEVFANRIEQYIVNLLMTKKSQKTKKIAERVLNDLCNVTGDKTSMQYPKTTRERTLVVIATRLAFWFEDIVKDLDKPREERPPTTEEEEEEESEEEEEPKGKKEREEKSEKEDEKEEEQEKERPKTEEEPVEEDDAEKPTKETPYKEDKRREPSKEEEKPTEQEAVEKEEPVKEEETAEEKPAPEEEPVKTEEPSEQGKAQEEEPPQEKTEDEKPAKEEETVEEKLPVEEKKEEEQPKEEEKPVVEEVAKEEQPEEAAEIDKTTDAEVTPQEEESKPKEQDGEVVEETVAEEEVPIEKVTEEKEAEDKIPAVEEEEKKSLEDQVGLEPLLEPEEKTEEKSLSKKESEKLPSVPRPKPHITIPRKPAMPAFEVRAKTGSTLQIQKLSSGTVVDKTAQARGVEAPPRRKVPESESPMNLKSAEEWVDWATNIATVGAEWGKWLDNRLSEGEKQLADKRKHSDWKAWLDQTRTEALKWRVEEERIKDEGKRWDKKLYQQKNRQSEQVVKTTDLD